MFKNHPAYSLTTLFISLIAVVFLPLAVAAQDKIAVVGIITSKENNQPIEAASIILNNKNSGSVSNADGNFIIAIAPAYTSQDSLNITCIGYKPYNVSIHDAVGHRNIIKLETAIEDLQEVLIKPLNLKQLLDTIISKNKQALISPLAVNGYYRELVFVNDKCTEYADALCQYFYDKNKDDNGQLKIDASRCRLEKVDKNQDYKNLQIYPDSKVNPNTLFTYVTQLSDLFYRKQNCACLG